LKNSNFIKSYFEEVSNIIDKISKNDIDEAIELLDTARKQGKKVFVIGNGGSASTATHFACDLNKYASVEGNKRFRAISLEDNVPLVTALVNDEGWDNVYSYQLENLMDDGDYLVAISVHGGSGKDKAALWSQNLLKAIKMVQSRGGKTVGLVGFDGGLIKEVADVCITVPVNSTPQVEGFHLILTHLICSIIRERLSGKVST
jgi:D-sedoheptulose 7-phosphate isomerase